ncbi:hypothetical protein AXF42_Ash014754 [Apostasia shenzhenica]|uniref:Uncharacterized protein n=1 Tax=Apostasia shenzhenica TaxID=1088818 RepID=A0A2H9ZW67_9ASPA|nr:hypothetical protein AXF42_Ash014754 [Apostasia shenzhenica]
MAMGARGFMPGQISAPTAGRRPQFNHGFLLHRSSGPDMITPTIDPQIQAMDRRKAQELSSR